jgi:RNA methyltransferase, TrmH family
MLSKNKIKYLRSLKLNKFRQMYNNFVVEGEKIALELLSSKKIEIESIVCTSAWYEQQQQVLAGFGTKLLIAKPKEMAQITFLKTATEVMIVAKQLAQEENKAKINKELSLYLDNIQNPGNFGTIMRIADWFGINTVFCSETSADLYNPKVIQSTMGAFMRVLVIKTNFERLKIDYPELPIYGTVLEGENLFTTSLEQKGVIVIGSEGKGISQAIMPYITHPITIPAHPNGGSESLNAGVAAGIVCAVFRNRA